MHWHEWVLRALLLDGERINYKACKRCGRVLF